MLELLLSLCPNAQGGNSGQTWEKERTGQSRPWPEGAGSSRLGAEPPGGSPRGCKHPDSTLWPPTNLLLGVLLAEPVAQRPLQWPQAERRGWRQGPECKCDHVTDVIYCCAIYPKSCLTNWRQKESGKRQWWQEPEEEGYVLSKKLKGYVLSKKTYSVIYHQISNWASEEPWQKGK